MKVFGARQRFFNKLRGAFEGAGRLPIGPLWPTAASPSRNLQPRLAIGAQLGKPPYRWNLPLNSGQNSRNSAMGKLRP